MDFSKLSHLEQLMFKLTYCKGIGIIGKWKLLEFANRYNQTDFNLETIIKIAEIYQYRAIFRKSWHQIDEEWLMNESAKQQFLTWLSPEYPSELKNITHFPLILFYQGHLSLLQYPKMSFVGARQASSYAAQVLYHFIPKIVEKNYVIVSGLAKGVDHWSHEIAIRSGGSTIGIIGCGLDRCYPREVEAVFNEMKQNHLVLSEYPEGTGVQRNHFPMRNRIIAGLSQGTCVLEAREKSGSLITAQLALEYGREVFAVPGDIVSGQSNGCHHLIQDGAKCVYSIEDIFDELPTF